MTAKKYFSIFSKKNLERKFWSAIFEHENNAKKNITRFNLVGISNSRIRDFTITLMI